MSKLKFELSTFENITTFIKTLTVEDVLYEQSLVITSCEIDYEQLGKILDELTGLNLTKLTHIALSENQLSKDGIENLSNYLISNNNSLLTTLELDNNQLKDDSMSALAKLINSQTSLKSLDLHCNNIGDGGIKTLLPILDNNNSVNTLYVSGNNLTDISMQGYITINIKRRV